MNNEAQSPNQPAPTSNLIITTSFFDDDDSTNIFTFLPTLSHHYKDLSVPFAVKGKLSVNQNESKSSFLSLHNNILAQYHVIQKFLWLNFKPYSRMMMIRFLKLF